MLFAVIGTRPTGLGHQQYGVYLTRDIRQARAVAKEESLVGPARLVHPRNESAYIELARLFAHNADRIEDNLPPDYQPMVDRLREFRDQLIRESCNLEALE